jgi:hypothetical protein
MKANIQIVIKAISDLNNRYRDSCSDIRTKLESLWEMGDCLMKLGVNKPHSIGWTIQKETKGLIKRPTIFRSYKIRTIWTLKDSFLRDIGDIKKLSYITDILPLIDPQQEVRKELNENEIEQIYKKACSDSTSQFKSYISKLKTKYSHGRLGKPLNKTKYLLEIEFVTKRFSSLQRYLLNLVEKAEFVEREKFRKKITPGELRAFSNMCISLTTKNNFRLYKKKWPSISYAQNYDFKVLYDYFYSILGKSDDTERARVRRLISPEAFAQMSDIILSMQNEESLDDFRSRQQLSIGM